MTKKEWQDKYGVSDEGMQKIEDVLAMFGTNEKPAKITKVRLCRLNETNKERFAW